MWEIMLENFQASLEDTQKNDTKHTGHVYVHKTV